MYLDEPEMVNVRLGSDPLHIVRLDVFDRNHIFPSILEPANDNKFAEYTRTRLQRGLGVLRRRSGRRHYRCRGRRRIGSIVRILHNQSRLLACVVPNVATIDVSGVRTLLDQARIPRVIHHYDHRPLIDHAVGWLRLHRRSRVIPVLVVRSGIRFQVRLIVLWIPVTGPTIRLIKHDRITRKEPASGKTTTNPLSRPERRAGTAINESTTKPTTAEPTVNGGRARTATNRPTMEPATGKSRFRRRGYCQKEPGDQQ
jgi:hypothetical protein